MDLIPLGIASAVPACGRHLASAALQVDGRIILFDCGEGTQFQLKKAGLRHSRIDAICITHLHGDHYFGLMGLLASMALARRTVPLTLVGPYWLAEALDALPGARDDDLTFPINHVRLQDGFTHAVVYNTKLLSVSARPVEHRSFAAGFRVCVPGASGNLNVALARQLGAKDYQQFQALKRGESVVTDSGNRISPRDVVSAPASARVFAYVSDTRPCAGGRELARNATLLWHEATFADDMQVRAIETGHSTAREAASVAREASAEKLLLGHFSARYPDIGVLEVEAREIFPNTEVACELKRYPVVPNHEPAPA